MADPIPMIHEACGGVALYRVTDGAEVLADDVILVDGSVPNPGDDIICGSCGENVSPEELHPG